MIDVTRFSTDGTQNRDVSGKVRENRCLDGLFVCYAVTFGGRAARTKGTTVTDAASGSMIAEKDQLVFQGGRFGCGHKTGVGCAAGDLRHRGRAPR